MPIRSLNGLDYSVRSLNGLSNVIDYSVSLPLTMDSDYNIKLSNLTSYGTANQILKMNSNGTALEFTNESDTIYTVALPLTLSAQNKISLSSLTSYGTDNQILRMNGTTSIEWSNETDTVYTGGTNITISNQNVINLDTDLTNLSSANITNTILLGTTSNPNSRKMVIDGDLEIKNNSIFFTSGGGMIFNDDSNSVISRNATNNINQFGNIADLTEILSLTGGKFTFPNSLTIKIDGNATSEISLLRNNGSLTNDDYLKINSTGKVVGVQNIPYSDITGTPSIPTILFSKSGNNINPLNTTDNLLLGTTTNTNSRKFVIEGLMDIEGSIFFTTGGGHIFNANNHGILGRTSNGETDIGTSQSPSLIQGSTSTTFKGTSNVVQVESTLRFMNSGGMLRNQQGNALISFDNTSGSEKNTFGISANITQILGSTTLYSNPIETNSIISFTADGAMLMNPNFNPIITYSSTNPIFMYNTFGNISERTTILGQGTILLGGPTCGLEITHKFTVNDGIYDIMVLGNGSTNLLGHMSFNTHLVGSTIELGTSGSASNNCYIRSANLVVTYHNTTNLLYKAGINSNRYQITCNAIEGNFYNPSDDRIKFNETPLINALDTINKLKPVKYDKKYNQDLYETEYGVEMEHAIPDIAQEEYGYIAQETYNDIPELKFCVGGVDESIPENFDENGKLIEDCKIRTTNLEGDEFIDRKYLSLDYNSINVLNVRAVQELSEIVKQQQEQINILINKLL